MKSDEYRLAALRRNEEIVLLTIDDIGNLTLSEFGKFDSKNITALCKRMEELNIYTIAGYTIGDLCKLQKHLGAYNPKAWEDDHMNMPIVKLASHFNEEIISRLGTEDEDGIGGVLALSV